MVQKYHRCRLQVDSQPAADATWANLDTSALAEIRVAVGMEPPQAFSVASFIQYALI